MYMPAGGKRWLVALVALGCLVLVGALAAIRAQNSRNPQAAQPKPVAAKPIQIQPIQVQPAPVPAQPIKPKRPEQVPPGGAGAQPVPPQVIGVPVQLHWEYRVVEFVGRDTDEHTKTLNQLAADGWEYVGLINLFATQTNGTTNGQPSGLVAFRRPKANPNPVVPLPAPVPAVPRGVLPPDQGGDED